MSLAQTRSIHVVSFFLFPLSPLCLIREPDVASTAHKLLQESAVALLIHESSGLRMQQQQAVAIRREFPSTTIRVVITHDTGRTD